jgi:RNA polymerase sigma-70 factor (ECF subfamily)
MTVFTDAEEATFKADLTALIPQMRGFARGLCGDPTYAHDLTQDALFKAWNSRRSFTPGTNLKAWLFMILRNGFYSDCRRSWRSTQLDQEAAERTLVAVNNPDGGLELNDLRLAMNMLPREQREALTLIGAVGLSYDEAAEICGTATGTIKSRVSRARAQLLVILAEGDLVHDDIRPNAAMAQIFMLADRLRLAA